MGLRITVKHDERRDEQCQKVTEQDLRVRDPGLEEVGVWDAERAEVARVVTAQEQDLREIACVLPAEPKFRIRLGHHVMTWNAPSVEVKW